MTRQITAMLVLTLLLGTLAMAQTPADSTQVQDSTYVQTKTMVDSMLTTHSGLPEETCAEVSDDAVLDCLRGLVSHGVPGVKSVLSVLNRRRIL